MAVAADGGVKVYAGVLAGSGGRELESRQRGGDLAVALYSAPPYDVQVPPLAMARLSINLSPAAVDGALDGERERRFLAQRHSLFLTPAGAGAHWRKAAPSRHINIYFQPQPGAETPLLNTGLVGGAPLFDALAAELAAGDAFAEEAADSLARLILVRLMRRSAEDKALHNPLTPGLLQRLRDFVQAHLDQRLLVADLAAQAGLPPSRFAQAFVAQTGLSPHQFVLQQRLQRAQALLQHTLEPLADVAAACGFASQQHMTDLVRKRLGSTPGRLRAAQCLSPSPCTSRCSQALKTM